MFKRNIPNIITGIRILGTVCLLFLEPLSLIFYIVYTISGISDALDGWAARKMKLQSSFGSKLDSVADLLFYTVMMIKIFPVLWENLPKTIWIVVGIILILRLADYTVTAVKYRKFAALHTYMNKLTGALLFLLPYSIHLPILLPHSVVICAVALFATVQELAIHIKDKSKI